MVFLFVLISGAVHNLEVTNIVGKLHCIDEIIQVSGFILLFPSSEGMSEVLLQCFMP
jgi:hypothetical protein